MMQVLLKKFDLLEERLAHGGWSDLQGLRDCVAVLDRFLGVARSFIWPFK